MKLDNDVYKGKALIKNCYMVMQDVNHQLFTESVFNEVLLSMPQQDTKKVGEILKQLDLYHVKDAHPLSLSGGQKAAGSNC
jgi:energy-coupling factor transport system ATP-binding protein